MTTFLATSAGVAARYAQGSECPPAVPDDPADIAPVGWTDPTCVGCADVAWGLAESCPMHETNINESRSAA